MLRISNGSKISADVMELLICAQTYPYVKMDTMVEINSVMNSLDLSDAGGTPVDVSALKVKFL